MPRLQMRLLNAVTLTTLFLANVVSVACIDENLSLQGPKRKLQHSFISREGCFGYGHIQFEGVGIFQRPLTTGNPDECCAACQARDDCAGWEFRACCNHCSLWSDITKVNDCVSGDCVAGIVDRNLRYRQTEEYREIPAERRYNGLDMTCQQRKYYGDISSVMVACNEVMRRCAPSSVKAEQRPLPYVGPDCEFDEDMNYYGSDYNDGFTELKLTPADCCRRCMQDRSCHAWTRTFSGQCWLKWEVPPEHQWLKVAGDVSGKRQHLNATCGPTFTGYFIDSFNDWEKAVPEGVETPEQCCQECINRNACLVWSFFEGECRILYSPSNNMVRNPDAISAFAITAPPSCDGSSESAATPLDIALAYNVDCASILISGPGESREGCRGGRQANNIFTSTYERISGIV